MEVLVMITTESNKANALRMAKLLIQKKLCDFWEIDYVLCRESGSYSQKNWESIVSGSNMKLFLVKRPKLKNDYSQTFYQYEHLIDHIISRY